jgi:endo-1,4-beta-xylanase
MILKTICTLLLLSASVSAADHPQEILLWPNGAPGSEGNTSKEVVTPRPEPGGGTSAIVSNIHNPSITPFLPAKEKATGAAVIIAPGGGHRFLSIDHEGYTVAKWLSEHGIAGFVLKYRLAKSEASTYKVEVHALQDAQRAIRLVRSRSQAWGINPARVGILGFSAGGEVAALASTNYDAGLKGASDPIEHQKSRPDFQVLIYSGLPQNMNVTKDTPPTLLMCAADDRPAISEGTATLYLTLKKAGVPVELHIYASGGHGFGIRNRPKPVSGWPTRLQEWMGDLGFLRGP